MKLELRQHLLPTGTSTTFNTALVFLSPSKSSQPMRKKKSIIMQATDAGNETVLKLIKEWEYYWLEYLISIDSRDYISIAFSLLQQH